MFSFVKWLVIALAIPSALWAADNPRHIDLGPGINAVKSLEQNWDDAVSNWFYNVPQGSRLLPYDWYIHLEQANSQELFNDPNTSEHWDTFPGSPTRATRTACRSGSSRTRPTKTAQRGWG